MKQRKVKTKLEITKKIPDDQIAKLITPQEQLFCELYAGLKDPEYRGNGTRAFQVAFDVSSPKIASPSAYRLLSNVHICKYIDKVIDKMGFNDQNIDSQLLFIINQYSDLGAKTRAIAEYNKLKARVTEKIESTVKVDISSMNDLLKGVKIDK